MNRHYVAFIGPQDIHHALAEMEETWNLQKPVTSLDEFEYQLGEPEEEKISKDTLLIIIFSRLYRENPAKFAELVAYIAPYSPVCILIPEVDKEDRANIERDVRAVQRHFASEDDSYNQNTPFYFVAYETPLDDIQDSIFKFVKSPLIDPEISESVAVMLPQAELSGLEVVDDPYFNAFDDIDDLTIPDREPNDKSVIISVTASKGGSGKSTISMLLGAYIAKSSQIAAEKGLTSDVLKVCTVDFNIADGQLGFINGVLRPSIIDIVQAGEPNITNIKQGIYTNPKTNVDFIFAARRPRNASSIPPAFYVDLLSTLRVMYDVIILDTSVNYLDPNSLLENIAYPMSDKIIVVSDFAVPAVLGTSRWIKEVCLRQDAPEKNIDRSKVAIVLNKSLKGVNMSVETIQKSARGIPVIAALPNAPVMTTYYTNTASTEQILNDRVFNESFSDIVHYLLPQFTWAPVPFRHRG